MRRPKREIGELVKLGRIRNRLLTASTLRTELRLAAERVMRLSEPGTPERLFTLISVADDSMLSVPDIVDAIIEVKRERDAASPAETQEEKPAAPSEIGRGK